MKCPICDCRLGLGGQSRCPGCGQALTTWINCAAFGRQAYQAGLHALAGGETAAAAEWLLRAVVFAPEEPAYLAAYGRVLGQLGRYAEAASVLGRCCEIVPDPETRAAQEKALALSRQAADTEPLDAPPDDAS
jgi:hypothetical protein